MPAVPPVMTYVASAANNWPVGQGEGLSASTTSFSSKSENHFCRAICLELFDPRHMLRDGQDGNALNERH